MSKPYAKPSLLEQFGLKPDPNKLEHSQSGGNRLTKVYTTGGHPMDSSQKGFPVYHRRIGNPFPLVALAIGTSLMIIAPILLGVRGLTQLNIFMAIGLPLGCVGNFIASMFAYAEGNTFTATLGSVFGGLLGGLSIAFLPWTGIQAAYIGKAASLEEGILDLYKALSLLFFCAMIPVFLVFLASFKTAMPIAGGALMIVIAVILQGTNYLHYPMLELQKGCGALFFIVGIVLWYLAVAIMNQEEGVPVVSLNSCSLSMFLLPKLMSSPARLCAASARRLIALNVPHLAFFIISSPLSFLFPLPPLLSSLCAI
ncbi:hypothetical protein FA10DRAFT_198096 [Acaromyces ingoldii]|uniref:Uncharacterized protein n=1 Tax=Acaromyces ingoldii TaxID=215250 RepID=A0A316YDA4_9BASI|nr:hypothetical protein FA10DRAFT_198096 [Acaromyces ingoldii]PWN87209.1 hypothetical protein FA10DRAFT_198096 [Acaromyces ingoldii]